MTIFERIAIRSAGRGLASILLGFILGLIATALFIGILYWIGTFNLTP